MKARIVLIGVPALFVAAVPLEANTALIAMARHAVVVLTFMSPSPMIDRCGRGPGRAQELDLPSTRWRRASKMRRA
jgi:hypothetical protein